jgi:hypothetical protein
MTEIKPLIELKLDSYVTSILDDYILLQNNDKFTIVNLASAKIEFADIKNPLPTSEYIFISFDPRLTKDKNHIIVKGPGRIYKIDIRDETKTIGIDRDGTFLKYISDDLKTLLISNDGIEMFVKHNGEIIYTFATTILIEFDGVHLYYIVSKEGILMKYNVFTKESLGRIIGYHIHDTFHTERYLILYQQNKRALIYDKETMKLKYNIDNLTYHNNEFIYCVDEVKDKKTIDIRHIGNGEIFNTFIFSNNRDVRFFNDFVCVIDADIATVYKISGEKLGYIKCPNILYRNTIEFCDNYIYTVRDNNIRTIGDYRFTCYDISDLYNKRRKKEFLKGKYSPESSIARTANNTLFDEHLFGEIFQFMGEIITIE